MNVFITIKYLWEDNGLLEHPHIVGCYSSQELQNADLLKCLNNFYDECDDESHVKGMYDSCGCLKAKTAWTAEELVEHFKGKTHYYQGSVCYHRVHTSVSE